jgi:hypothetical protein
MALKKATEVAESVKTRREAAVHSQVDALMENIEKSVEAMMENTFIEVDLPEDTISGVLTTVVERLRELGYKTCLVEQVNRESEIIERRLRVSVAHLG